MNINMAEFNQAVEVPKKVEATKPIGSISSNKEESNFTKVLNAEKKNVSSDNDDKSLEVKSTQIGDNNVIGLENNKTAELKDTDIKEIVEKMSIEDLVNALSMIADLLNNNKVGTNPNIEVDIKDLNVNVRSIISSILSKDNSEAIDTTKSLAEKISNLANKISLTNDSSYIKETTSSKDIASILNNLLTALKDNNIEKALDKDSLNTIKNMLKELGIKLEGNEAVIKNEDQSFIQELVKEVEGQVKNLLDKKPKETINKQVLNDINLPNEEIVKADDSKKVEAIVKDNNFTKNEAQSDSKSNNDLEKRVAKEENILKSILGDDSDSKVSKFSLFTDRVNSTRVEVPTEAQVINKGTMTQDVIKNVKYMVNNDVKELVVKINPKELGEMAIKIVHEDGVMRASIKASSKETYNLLSQNLNDIKKYIGESNIKIQEVNISLYNEDTTYYKDENFSSNLFKENRENQEKNRNNSSNHNKGNVNEESVFENEAEDISNIDMLA